MSVKTSTLPPILLASASQNFFAGRDTLLRFEAMLRLNLLFQPGGVALPDTYLFSSCVLAHFGQSRFDRTLLDRAIDKGLITILARGHKKTGSLPNSFMELLAHMRDVNLAGPTMSDAMTELAELLDSRHKGQAFPAKLWPRKMGQSFKNSIHQRLLVGTSDVETRITKFGFIWNRQDRMLQFHRDTEAWRQCIFEATEGDDLRLSIIMKKVWTQFVNPTPPEDITIAKLQEEIRRTPRLGRTNSQYFSVLSDFYNNNFATAFGLQTERVDYDHIKRLYVDDTPELQQPESIVDPITVRLPSVERLIEWPPEAIIACRSNASFIAYHEALQAWAASPLDVNAHDQVLWTLEPYAAYICDQDRTRGPSQAKIQIAREAFRDVRTFFDDSVRTRLQRRRVGVTVVGLAVNAARAKALFPSGQMVERIVSLGLKFFYDDLQLNFYTAGSPVFGPHPHF